jgi:hypothetical protein
MMDRYRKDPRVVMLVKNSRALRSGRASLEETPNKIPPLPSLTPQ